VIWNAIVGELESLQFQDRLAGNSHHVAQYLAKQAADALTAAGVMMPERVQEDAERPRVLSRWQADRLEGDWMYCTVEHRDGEIGHRRMRYATLAEFGIGEGDDFEFMKQSDGEGHITLTYRKLSPREPIEEELAEIRRKAEELRDDG
jgi:hypothetical protein